MSTLDTLFKSVTEEMNSQKKEPEIEKPVLPPEEKIEPATEEITVYKVAPPKEAAPEERKSLFEDFMSHVDTSKMELTPDQGKHIQQNAEMIDKSMNGIISQCSSNECKHLSICPFHSIKKYPVGQLCPVEVCIASHSAKQYFTHLEDELGTNNFNVIEISTIKSLVEIEVEEFRARTFANTEGMLVDQPAFAIRRTGEVVFNRGENPVYNIIEKLSRRKNRLLQRLLLTPEARARFHIDRSKDRGSKTKEIVMRAEEKIRQFKEIEMNGKNSQSSE